MWQKQPRHCMSRMLEQEPDTDSNKKIVANINMRTL